MFIGCSRKAITKSLMAASSPTMSLSIAASNPVFPSPIVEAKHILDKMNENGFSFKFLDASWHLNPARDAKKEFNETRIKGASFFDIDKISTKSDLPHMLPTASIFKEACFQLGIAYQQENVCIYVTDECFSAARAWWMFHCFQHRNVYVINGGLPEWIKAGGPIEENHTNPTELDDLSAYYSEAELDESLVVNWSQVLDISSKIVERRETDVNTPVILDARSKGRFLGTAPEPREGLRGGHIPGSLSLPFSELLLGNNRFKPDEEMIDVFKSLGVTEESEVITSCGSGVTAAVISLAYHQCFGAQMKGNLKIPAVYDGSWSEWGGREDLPIEK